MIPVSVVCVDFKLHLAYSYSA